MITLHQVHKYYGRQDVLKGVSLHVGPGERLGLVGPNGAGKSTLLGLMLGTVEPDQGEVFRAKHLRLGYLPQELLQLTGQTVLELAMDTGDGLSQVEAELWEVHQELAENPSPERYDELLIRQGRLQTAFEGLGGYDLEARASKVLAGLGFTSEQLSRDVATLSGGWLMRAALARILLSNPDLILLDEPTNHLDLEMLAWLEGWLSGFRGAAVIVSHDRAFLDATVTRLLEIDPRTQQLRSYTGNYADYLEQKQAEVERQWQAYGDWQVEVARLRDAARRLRGLAVKKKGGKGDSGDKFAKGFFNDQTTRMVKRARHIEQRLERLLTDERAEKPRRVWQMKLDFEGGSAGGRDVLRLEGLAVGYDRPLLGGLDLLIRHGERVALIGPNGSGKTTLVRTLTGEVPPLAGQARLGAQVRVGYFAQEHDRLRPELNALETVRPYRPDAETGLRAFLHYFLFQGDAVFTPVAALSFGERARLTLATLVAQGCNFLILDEPINHLDIASRERFEQALDAFDGTALFITHDRYFIERCATQVWRVEAETVRAYADLADALSAHA